MFVDQAEASSFGGRGRLRLYCLWADERAHHADPRPPRLPWQNRKGSFQSGMRDVEETSWGATRHNPVEPMASTAFLTHAPYLMATGKVTQNAPMLTA